MNTPSLNSIPGTHYEYARLVYGHDIGPTNLYGEVRWDGVHDLDRSRLVARFFTRDGRSDIHDTIIEAEGIPALASWLRDGGDISLDMSSPFAVRQVLRWMAERI
jgi:hypothetical protein